jgi:transcriptional regulator with XRE-family HTH domain
VEEKALDIWIGRRLRWARELTYGSGAAFARVMGISQGHVNRMERGERSFSYLNLVSAANKLQTGTEYLLTGDLSFVETELKQALLQLHPELRKGPQRELSRRPLLVPRTVRIPPRYARALPQSSADTDTDPPLPHSDTARAADTASSSPRRTRARASAQ